MDRLYAWFWDSGVYYILYSLVIIVGIYTSKKIIETPLKEKVTAWQYRYRLRKVRADKAVVYREKDRNAFFQHIYLLVKTTSREKTDSDVYAFYFISLSLVGFFGLIGFMKFNDFVLASLVGILVAFIPYMFLRVRLRKIRHVMGSEFLSMVQTLTQNYNANSFDMYHALVDTQKTIKAKELRRIFVRLISDLQVSRNEEELRDTINIFIYTSGTSWAKRLGSIMLKAYVNDENVLHALLVLGKQIEETEEMLEQEKSHSMDHVANGLVTAPVFLGALVLGYFSSGSQNWFELQFENQIAVTLFVVSLIGVVFSVFISLILFRPKNDI